MADAKIGEFKCETKKIHKSWEVEKWNDGEACVEICENLAKQHGPGCCEARHRADFTKAFCIFTAHPYVRIAIFVKPKTLKNCIQNCLNFIVL